MFYFIKYWNCEIFFERKDSNNLNMMNHELTQKKKKSYITSNAKH